MAIDFVACDSLKEEIDNGLNLALNGESGSRICFLETKLNLINTVTESDLV